MSQEEKKTLVAPLEIAEISSTNNNGQTVKDIGFLKEIALTLTVELGRINMNIEDVLLLGPGAVITLKRQIHEPVDLLIHGKLVAHGEIVAVDDHLGVRITDIIKDEGKL
jgi:flagellar motor switch protein FliN/FliY